MGMSEKQIDCFTEAEMSVAKRCANCSFWTQNTKSLGYCKRFPPVWIGDRYDFPITVYATWCGEFKASAEAIKNKHEELTKNPPHPSTEPVKKERYPRGWHPDDEKPG